MAKIDLTEQAKEILKIAEDAGVQSNFFFVTTLSLFDKIKYQV